MKFYFGATIQFLHISKCVNYHRKFYILIRCSLQLYCSGTALVRIDWLLEYGISENIYLILNNQGNAKNIYYTRRSVHTSISKIFSVCTRHLPITYRNIVFCNRRESSLNEDSGNSKKWGTKCNDQNSWKTQRITSTAMKREDTEFNVESKIQILDTCRTGAILETQGRLVI